MKGISLTKGKLQRCGSMSVYACVCVRTVRVCVCVCAFTIILFLQARLVQSRGLKRLWAPFCGSTRNSPMGTVPEHHSNTPLRWENGTTWGTHTHTHTKCMDDTCQIITQLHLQMNQWLSKRNLITFSLRLKYHQNISKVVSTQTLFLTSMQNKGKFRSHFHHALHVRR